MQKSLENQAVLWRLRVAIDAPLAVNFDYLAPADTTPSDVGLRVVVPFGSGRRVGLILAVLPLSGDGTAADAPAADQLKPAESILRDLPPMPADWISLCLFAASYYQAAPGEALLQAQCVGSILGWYAITLLLADLRCPCLPRPRQVWPPAVSWQRRTGQSAGAHWCAAARLPAGPGFPCQCPSPPAGASHFLLSRALRRTAPSRTPHAERVNEYAAPGIMN